MKNLLYFLILAPFFSFCQESIDVSFVKKTNLDFEVIVDIDNFGIIYYLNNNTFYKNNSGKIIYYNNIQLGHITSVNTFNPLKIPIFYKNFNLNQSNENILEYLNYSYSPVLENIFFLFYLR